MNVVSLARLGSGTHTSSDLESQLLQSLDSPFSNRWARYRVGRRAHGRIGPTRMLSTYTGGVLITKEQCP
jgi:hypothetical protein